MNHDKPDQGDLAAANARIAELAAHVEELQVDLADAVRGVEHHEGAAARLLDERDAANARAEAAERETKFWRDETATAQTKRAESESAALRAEMDTERRARGQDIRTLNGEVEKWKGLAHEECQRRSMAEVSRDELRAELKDKAGYDVWMRAAKELGAKLDAANALLQYISDEWDNEETLQFYTLERLSAHLAAQPATAPLDADQVAKACCDIAWNNGWVLTYKLERAAQPATAPTPYGTADESPGFNAAKPLRKPATAPAQGWDVDDLVGKPATAPTRTEAEQRVLDAMASAPAEELACIIDGDVDAELWERQACKAELARRAVSK
jgi:hypothetical protein